MALLIGAIIDLLTLGLPILLIVAIWKHNGRLIFITTLTLVTVTLMLNAIR